MKIVINRDWILFSNISSNLRSKRWEDVGLSHFNGFNFDVIDEKKFMLAVIEHGIEYKVVK